MSLLGSPPRTFGERYKEHFTAPSPISEQQGTAGHLTTVHNFKIIGREGHNMVRAMKQDIYVCMYIYIYIYIYVCVCMYE